MKIWDSVYIWRSTLNSVYTYSVLRVTNFRNSSWSEIEMDWGKVTNWLEITTEAVLEIGTPTTTPRASRTLCNNLLNIISKKIHKTRLLNAFWLLNLTSFWVLMHPKADWNTFFVLLYHFLVFSEQKGRKYRKAVEKHCFLVIGSWLHKTGGLPAGVPDFAQKLWKIMQKSWKKYFNRLTGAHPPWSRSKYTTHLLDSH